MAPLTWREVAAPNFSGANASMAQAAQLLDSGLNSITKSLDSFQANRRKANTNVGMSEILKLQQSGGLQEALMNGTLLGGINPSQVNPELYEFIAQQPQRLLNQEQTMAQTQGTQASTARVLQGTAFDAQDQSRKGELQARADAQFNAAPQLMETVFKIRDGLQSGDEIKINEARKLQAASAGQFSAAGVDPLAVTQFIDGNLDTARDGMQFNKDTLANSNFITENNRSLFADGIAERAWQNKDNPEAAIAQIYKDAGNDSKLLQASLNAFEQRKGLYAPVDQGQLLVDSLSGGKAPAAPVSSGSAPDPSTYIKYANQNSSRNLPVNPNLAKAMDFLPNMGITMQVSSGGQSSKGEFANGTATSNGYVGSTRHVHGDAADVQFLTKGGRALSWEKAEDVPMLQEIVRQSKSRGLTGFGAAKDYMGDTTTHIGFGTPAVWGQKGGAPYAALAQAFGSAADSKAPPKVQQQYYKAMESLGNGETYKADIDLSRPRLDNGDGTYSTEETITTEVEGMYFNIPTIFNGERVSEEQAIDLFNKGQNPPVGAFKELKAAEEAAIERTEQIGKKIANEISTGSLNTPNNGSEKNAPASVAPNGVPQGGAAFVDNFINEVTKPTQVDTPTPASIGQGIQTVADTLTVDQSLNGNEDLINELVTRPNHNENKAQTINRLTSKEGPLARVPAEAVTDAINQTMLLSNDSLSSDMAAALISRNIESRELSAGFFGSLFGSSGSDDYGSATEGGNKASRIDMEGVKRDLEQLFVKNKEGKLSLAPGVSQIQNQRGSAEAGTQIGALNSELQKSQQRIINAQAQVNSGKNINLQEILIQETQRQAQILEALRKLGGTPGPVTTFSGTALK